MANWARSGPTTGLRRISPSQTRRPFSDLNQVRSERDRHDGHSRDIEPVVAHGLAGLDDHLGQKGQVRIEALEDDLEPRNEEDHEEDQHADREDQQDDRVHQRAHRLRLDLLFPRLKVGDLRQHHVEESARLARLDHRHVDARKGLGRPGHRLGHRHAVDHHVVDFLPLLLGGRDRRFAVEDHQRPAEGHARGQQAGQQAGEVLQNPRGDLALARDRLAQRREADALGGARRRAGFGLVSGRAARRRAFFRAGAGPAAASARRIGRRPRFSTWRIASCRLPASSWPSVRTPSRWTAL